MTSKKNRPSAWLKPLLIAGVVTLLSVLYVWLFKTDTPRGFLLSLSDSLFLWGITLLSISLVYVTRFFGFMGYFQKWFRFQAYKPEIHEDPTGGVTIKGEETEKRDPSLVYASLLLILLSIVITL